MRRGWETVAFLEAPLQIVDGDRGKNYPKQTDFSEEGHCVFLNTGNVTDSGFNFSSVQFIDEAKDDALRKGKLTRDDVVMTTRGTIGNVAHYNENIPFDHLRINSGMVIFRCDRNRLSPLFLYHYLRSPTFEGQTNSLRSGAAQPQLPIRDIKQIQLPLPSFAEQLRVADVITTYDDLIENNRRRMALLEDAARQLYREWFVRLRFPGHEHTHITNGVPEGWEKETLGDRVTLNYGKALKAEDRVDGPCPVYGSSGIVGMHEKALAVAPGIVVGRKGNVGSVFWCPKDYWPIDTAYFIDAETSNLWLFYVLRHMHFISTDVAVPGLNRDFAYSRPLLVPEPRIVRDFLETAVPLHEQIAKLDEINEKLRAARDLLLPRLMNGEIVV